MGYGVKSQIGTQFRIWATQRLKEYIIKGFTTRYNLLKPECKGNYFEELLDCLSDICGSEKVLWQKVLDIYTTGVDYNLNADVNLF